MSRLLFRFFLLVTGLFPACLQAEVRLPAIISDHMVLQAGESVPIWGWADPGEQVTVSLGSQKKTAAAGSDGRWMVKLDKLEPSATPQTLTVAGTNTLTVNDVLVGEVWLCSGQSNMGLRVEGTYKSEEEIPAAKHPSLRMFFVRSIGADTPQDECTGEWQVCSPETVGSFSATAYYFGKELQRVLGSPVGLINSSVGGTRIEAWTSADAQRAAPELKERVAEYDKEAAAFDPDKAKAKYEKDLAAWKEKAEQAKASGAAPPRAPMEPISTRYKQGRGLGFLFNGKIAPLIPYAIRGAIWYQGEANSGVDRVAVYGTQLPLLIKDWRTRWGSEFPFAWVQLPNFQGGSLRNWPAIREMMLETLKVNKTGMAIAIDIGQAGNIHAIFKPEVGRRLALWALGDVYGKAGATSGPLPDGHEIRDSEVVVRFTHTDGGLVTRGEKLTGFLIAGDDHQWKTADARIEGNTVVVSHPEIKKPAAVRYAWANNPPASLYNGAGLPASPFRTDRWNDAPFPEPPEQHDPPPPAATPKPVAAAPASDGVNIVRNGDFSAPINTDRRRGTWMLLIASSGPYVLAENGYATENNVLEVDLDALNPAGKAKPAIQFSQFVPPFTFGRKYQLSFESRAIEPGGQISVAAGVIVSGNDAEGGLKRQSFPLGQEFQSHTLDFTVGNVSEGTPDPQKYTRVDFRFENARGKIFLKNIRLVEVE